MKIAAITDDGKTISQHFGRAAHYLVCTVEDGKIVDTELRDKMGQQHFANEPQDHAEEADPRGHGFGPGPDRKHNQMIAAITDCEALLVRGMGRGAYIAVESANIRPVVTEHALIVDAVQAYIECDIVDHTEKLH